MSIPTTQPWRALSNAGHIVIVGNPQDGWKLTDWDGIPR
jgi:hypothetical protein